MAVSWNLSGGAPLTDRASRLPGAPPPVRTFFVARVLTWIVLTSACALPLMVLTWNRFTSIERFGEALGVLVWAVVMAILAERLGQSAMWQRGALVTAVMYAGLAIFAGPLGVFLWFAPAVWMGSPIARIAGGDSPFWAALAWTLICGGQTAVVAWCCGRVFQRGQREKTSNSH